MPSHRNGKWKMNNRLTNSSSGRDDNGHNRARALQSEEIEMNHIKTVVIAAGLLTAFATVGANAAFFPGKNNPNNPSPSPSASTECTFSAHRNPQLRTNEVAGIRANQQIWLTPVCEDQLDRNNYGTLFRDGNVETLRLLIARNPALMATLTARGYDHFDVVALRFGRDDSVNLFVHQRDMR
jgi:hypothetical protein